jgi:hypothetical protein
MEEQKKEVKFAISISQLQTLLDVIVRLPYNQAQPFVEMLTKLPRINEIESTKD